MNRGAYLLLTFHLFKARAEKNALKMLLQKQPQYLWLIVAKSSKNPPSLAPRHKTHSSEIWCSFYFNWI